MALIICEECGNKISNKAIICPYCGCPIENKEKVYCPSCDILKNQKVELILARDKSKYICPECKREVLIEGKSYKEKIIQEYNINSNTPKCPTCGSTNIEKISATSKVVGAVAFGLFSKTARSQFKCKNSGAKW